MAQITKNQTLVEQFFSWDFLFILCDIVYITSLHIIVIQIISEYLVAKCIHQMTQTEHYFIIRPYITEFCETNRILLCLLGLYFRQQEYASLISDRPAIFLWSKSVSYRYMEKDGTLL